MEIASDRQSVGVKIGLQRLSKSSIIGCLEKLLHERLPEHLSLKDYSDHDILKNLILELLLAAAHDLTHDVLDLFNVEDTLDVHVLVHVPSLVMVYELVVHVTIAACLVFFVALVAAFVALRRASAYHVTSAIVLLLLGLLVYLVILLHVLKENVD